MHIFNQNRHFKKVILIKTLKQLVDECSSLGVKFIVFPCNQFGSQEPGTNAGIKKFLESKYGYTGDLAAKIDVNGKNAHPLWVWMKNQPVSFTKQIIFKNHFETLFDISSDWCASSELFTFQSFKIV